MKSEYFQIQRNEEHDEKFFYEVLLPDLLLFAVVISISVALLILVFKTFG